MEYLRSTAGQYFDSDSYKFIDTLETLGDAQLKSAEIKVQVLLNTKAIIENILPKKLTWIELLGENKREDVYMFIQSVRCVMTVMRTSFDEKHVELLRNFCRKHHKVIAKVVLNMKGTSMKKTMTWSSFQAYLQQNSQHDYHVLLLDYIALVLFGKPWKFSFPADEPKIAKADINAPLAREEQAPFNSMITAIMSFARKHEAQCIYPDFYPRRHLERIRNLAFASVAGFLQSMTVHEAASYLQDRTKMDTVRNALKHLMGEVFRLNKFPYTGTMMPVYEEEYFVEPFLKRYKAVLEANLKADGIAVQKVAA